MISSIFHFRRPRRINAFVLAPLALTLLFLSAPAGAEEVGDHFEIDIEKLLESNPVKARMVMNFPREVNTQPAGASLQVPPGFKVNVFADGFDKPYNLVAAPGGDYFLADSMRKRIYVLRDADGDGVAEFRSLFVDGLKRPYGVAFQPGYVYIGTTGSVIRYAYEEGQVAAEGDPEVIVPELPFGGSNNHWTRNLLFNAEGTKLYISVGSASNLAEEPPHRAAILECNPDGSDLRIFASGLRNPVGLAWHPVTGELWTSVNERDMLGDDLVPDYVTSVKDGGFYGWPYFFLGDHADPRMGGKGEDLRGSVIMPDVLIASHSAALGMAFYEGDMFPEEYRGDLYVAFHGSWNRSLRTGYKIVRVRMEDGKPLGGYENFMVGWLPSPESPSVWGRPRAVTEAPDGALLIVDDTGDKVWRVSYDGAE